MSRVFVVQNQHRRNDRGLLEPKFDFSSAEEYGSLSYLLGPSAAPWNPEIIIPELHEKLKDFSSKDHLLLVGNPILIGWATAIAADSADGEISLLQWSGKDRRYISVCSQVFDWQP